MQVTSQKPSTAKITNEFQITNTLRVVIDPEGPASAQASSNIVRCTLSAVAVALLEVMIEKMGIGWTYTFYAGVCSLSGATFILERQVGVNLRTDRQRDNFSA